MRDHNRAFADASLTDVSFRTAKIDYMAVIASDGRFDWSRGLDSDNHKLITIRLNGDNQLEAPWARALAQGAPISGLIKTNAGVLIASGAPILDGFGRGPARGMVIMGRLLNSAELQRLGMQAQVKLDMRPWGRSPAADAPLLAALKADGAWLTESASATRIEQAFTQPVARPCCPSASQCRARSRSTARAPCATRRCLLGVAAGTALVTLLVLLGRIVLSPLARVTDHAERIAEADDLWRPAQLRSA